MEQDRTTRFVQAITESQSRLYAYILTLLPDHNAASDVLQCTNLILWKKSDQFDVETDFAAWSSSVAYFELLAYRKRKDRDRHIFSSALLKKLAETAADVTHDSQEKAAGLQNCLGKLSNTQLDLVRRRYRPGGSVAATAREMKRTENAVSQALYRIRKQLAQCIERHVARSLQD